MEDARVREKSSLLAWGREGVRGLFEGFQTGRAGHGLRLILGTAVGLLLLALVFRGVGWRQVGRVVAEANHPLLALALGTVLLTTLAKAARWRLLFPQKHGRPRLSKLFPVLLIGQTVNAVLPARLGEITRAYLIGEIEGVDKALALSTVIVEKAVDAWNIHAFILREERDSWGIDIPPGISDATGVLYEIEDHDDLELFKRQIVDFRRWMEERDERHKPLIVSEYGILMPEDYGFPYETVRDFMYETFDYFLTATDEFLGYPADGNRLVQRWAWYSLSDRRYPTSNLFDPETKEITPLGIDYQEYVEGLLSP